MRTIASLCLALLLAVTFGWSSPASAGVGPAASQTASSPCADMGIDMGDMAMPAKPPASSHKRSMDPCALSCSVGCAVPAEALAAPVGQPIGWTCAFGLPGAARMPASVTPEAQHPPPRTRLL